MRFLHPEFLWLLGFLPLFLVLRGRKGKTEAVLFPTASVLSMLGSSGKNRFGSVSEFLKMAAFCCLVLALARPQLGNTTTEVEASGIDILLAVDVSGSMEALDFTIQGAKTNRLEAVKSVVADFIEERPNDRIGLVAFAKFPYMVSPLTLDHSWLKKRLESLKIGMIEDGTAIGSAIGSGTNRLREQKSKSRIMILLTDGMSNAGKIAPTLAAEAAKMFKIKVYTIGAGTKGQAPMPVKDMFGRKRMVMTKVNIDEKTLQSVADMTGAKYFRATDTDSLSRIYDEINSMEKTVRKMKKFEDYRELFPYLVTAAFIFLGFALYRESSRLP